ncbi:carboxypeptidase regulatory-like domain-containing protein [Natronorubrum sediminis]|nr:carboxypeptidase regulatory-like domain-containing protein [Natronorubrum sediminis]
MAVLLITSVLGLAGGSVMATDSAAEPTDRTAALESSHTSAGSVGALSASGSADADHEVTPENTSTEAGERVSVDIEANQLVDDDEDAEITGFELDIDYDDDQLAFTDAETLLADDEDLEVETGDGTVAVEWVPSFLETTSDEGVDKIIGDGDGTPAMDTTVATVEFVAVGDGGETATVDVQDESTMWWGKTGLSEYDDDEIHWGSDEVEITEPSDESPTEGAQVGEFTTESQGGFIAFDEDGTAADAEDDGVSFPVADDGDDPIEIEGAVFDDGTWESTSVSFPTLDAGAADAEVEARDGLSGEIDDGEMMATEGELTVLVDGDEDTSFQFEIGSTTDDSNELSGDDDFDEDGGAVTLVDNEFLVEDRTGDSVIDSSLGLPSTEEGTNWFELDLDLDLDEVEAASGTVEGVVENEDGEPIEDATVESADGVGSTETDSDGAYDVALDQGSHDLQVDADGYAESTVEVDVSEGETTEQDVTLEEGDTEFDVDIDADDGEPGETHEVAGTVHNTGSDTGEQDVTVSLGDESTSETVEIEADEEETVSLEWEPDTDDTGEYTAEIESEDDSETTDIEVSESNESGDDEEGAGDNEEGAGDDTFIAHSQGGFISFAEDADRDEAFEEGLEFPAQGEDDEHIQIVGEIDGDSWESTGVTFPNLETDSGIEAEVDAPDGLSGTIDDETGEMTIEGELEVAIEGDEDRQFAFEIDTTTGESGSLEGASDASDESGAATLVDNEFVVDDTTGDSIIDSELDLPSVDEGTNWFELELALELDVDDDAASEASEAEDEGDDSDGDEDSDGSTAATIVNGVGLLFGLAGLVSGGSILSANVVARFQS